MPFAPSHTGYFGKLPARGDFLRTGLPEDFVAPLDAWCREILASTRAALGEGWEQAWMTGPIWHFLLPPGACGPRAVQGVWLASMDKAGRHYPFMLCALAEQLEDLRQGSAWAEAAEAAGLAAVVEDAPHGTLLPRLQPVTGDALAPGWWTEGSPQRAPCRFEFTSLFPAAQAAAMLAGEKSPEFTLR